MSDNLQIVPPKADADPAVTEEVIEKESAQMHMDIVDALVREIIPNYRLFPEDVDKIAEYACVFLENNLAKEKV